ncbi:MAG: MFS transporter [Candidatus Aenigmatarchaeota archaeon]
MEVNKKCRVMKMKKELLVVMLASILSSIGAGIFGPVYLLYYQKIGGYSEISMAFGIFWIALALMEIPFGYLSDRFDRKIFIIIGGILTSFVSLFYIFIKTVFELYLLEFLSGVATSIQKPSLQSLISEMASKKERGKIFGLFSSTVNLSYGVASLLSGILIGIFGISSIFIVSSLFQLTSTLIAFKIRKYAFE